MIVLRKTKVMISQNMNCDLQMYRTVRRFLRFHLGTIGISLVDTIRKLTNDITNAHFSNLFILFCRKVSGAPERSASASIVVS